MQQKYFQKSNPSCSPRGRVFSCPDIASGRPERDWLPDKIAGIEYGLSVIREKQRAAANIEFLQQPVDHDNILLLTEMVPGSGAGHTAGSSFFFSVEHRLKIGDSLFLLECLISSFPGRIKRQPLI